MNVLILLQRNVKWRFHNAFTILITILQPILWLVLYSAVAGQTMKDTGIENYTTFILPGLIVLVSFGTCSSSGIMNYLMKTDGSFYRVLIAPIHRSCIVLAQMLEAVLCAFLEVMIMVFISFLFSVHIPIDLTSLLCMAILVFLTAFFMAGLCYAISLILPNAVMYETIMNAIVLPVFFLSTALFPTDGIHGILATIIQMNPFTHVINTLRSLLLYGEIHVEQMLLVILLFLVLGSLSFLWAKHRLQRETSL